MQVVDEVSVPGHCSLPSPLLPALPPGFQGTSRGHSLPGAHQAPGLMLSASM